MGGDSGFGGLRERERERNINEKKRETQLKKQFLKYQLATITSYL